MNSRTLSLIAIVGSVSVILMILMKNCYPLVFGGIILAVLLMTNNSIKSPMSLRSKKKSLLKEESKEATPPTSEPKTNQPSNQPSSTTTDTPTKSTDTATTPSQTVSNVENCKVTKLYNEKDFQYSKPSYTDEPRKHNFMRPDNFPEPLHARKSFVKFWANDLPAYSMKDRYTVVTDTKKIKIPQKF